MWTGPKHVELRDANPSQTFKRSLEESDSQAGRLGGGFRGPWGEGNGDSGQWASSLGGDPDRRSAIINNVVLEIFAQ